MEQFNLLERYTLAQETSLIMGIVGVVLAILGIIISLLGKRRTDTVKIPVIIFCAVISIGSILLLWNYHSIVYDQEFQIVNVPNVEQLSYGNAQTIIRVFGLIERPVSAEGQVISAEQIVLRQEPAGNTAVPVGSDVILRVGISGSSTPDMPDTPELPSAPSDGESLLLSIDFVEETDSYHYEYPDPKNPNTTILIDFERGLSGTFSYSRPLTDVECANWYHGGKIYDENGIEVGSEGNWASFWSYPNGKFAVEFPKDFPAGRYTYELYQDISGQMVSDIIEFVID